MPFLLTIFLSAQPHECIKQNNMWKVSSCAFIYAHAILGMKAKYNSQKNNNGGGGGWRQLVT